MPTDLTRFGLADALRCGNAIRLIARDAPTMEAVARDVCGYLRDELVDRSGGRACALVRCYKTHALGALPPDLAHAATASLAGLAPAPDIPCLTLLGTAGEKPEWNDRRKSSGHRAIPLATPLMVAQAPMIAQLLRAFGVDASELMAPSPRVVRELGGKSYGVFHVPEALGSPHIPAQDFVRQYGIRSVVGCGGSLKNGDLFALILFSRVAIGAASADRFRAMALDLKGSLFLFSAEQVFDAHQTA